MQLPKNKVTYKFNIKEAMPGLEDIYSYKSLNSV